MYVCTMISACPDQRDVVTSYNIQLELEFERRDLKIENSKRELQIMLP